MITQLYNFWISSYRSDPKSFFAELISFLLTVIGSLFLAATANHPNMLMVYPFFTIGSIAQCYSRFHRKQAWILILGVYFTLLDVYGFGVAKLWW